jgi:hypothetical protein
MNCRTNCSKTFLFVLVVLALAIMATPAFAGSADPTLCLQTQYNQVQKQKLNCSANDVRVASVSNVTDLAGNTISTCIEGSTFSFIANFQVITTANAQNAGGRDNIGLYFQTDPTKTDALFGATCTDDIIAQNHPCATSGPAASSTCGAGAGYQEADASPDNCGDTSSSVNGNITDRILVKDFKCTTSNSVPCPFDSTKQCLSLPNCTSWQTPGSSSLCVATTPQSNPPGNWDYPFDASGNPEAIPGAPSKCNCGVVPLPVQPVNPKPLALKACNTTLTSGSPSFTFDTNNPPGTASPTNCDAGIEGQGTATYTVAVDNPNVSGAFGNIIIDQICDSAYGQIYPTSGGSCSTTGTVGTGTFVSCSTFDIALGSYATCTFTAPSIGELNSVNNIVTVSGHSKVTTTVTFSTQTNQVTVHSEDAPTTAAVAKTFAATIAACATVRYKVDVHNTSGFDEVETLSALSDTPFGSLTSVHDDVKGTTCGVANGAGTLSGTAGAGILPATIPVDGHYICNFDGQFCSAVDSGTCIQHDNQITTVTLIGDPNDTPAHTSFNTPSNTLTVKECLLATTP